MLRRDLPYTLLTSLLTTSLPVLAQTTFDLDRALPTTAPAGLLTEGFPLAPVTGISPADMGLLPGDDIDALSFGDDTAIAASTHTLVFSVDGLGVGVALSGVSTETLADTPPGLAPAAAGDLFMQGGGSNVLTPAGLGYQAGTTTGDEANAAWASPCDPTAACDNVDAFDYTSPFGASGVYFSLRFGSPTLGIIGAGPGDILYSELSGSLPVIATLGGGAGLATGANLGIGPFDLDALNLVGSTGPIAAGGGVISTGSIGKNIAGIFILTSHLLQYSIHAGAAADGDVFALSVPGTAVVHTPFPLMGLFISDNLNALEAVACSPVPASAFSYNGTGLNRDLFTSTTVVVGAPWTATIEPQFLRGPGAWIYLVRMNPSGGTLIDMGLFFLLPPAGLSELLVGAGFIANITLTPPHGGGGTATSNTINVPNNCALIGNPWYAQAIVFGDLPSGAGLLDPWFSTAMGGVIGSY